MKITADGEIGNNHAIAIVGGGRWARVFVSALFNSGLPIRLIVVSSTNAKKFKGLRDTSGSEAPVVSSVDDLLLRHKVAAAVVVNAARLHASAAFRLIEAGVSVLIEKPLALTQAEVGLLHDRAEERGVVLMPALSFLYCSYLKRFADTVRNRVEPVVMTHLQWSDPLSEVRYGEDKSYDIGISIAQDVMPHVWAILAMALNISDLRPDVKSCTIQRGGRQATFLLSVAGKPCLVSIERDAKLRRRLLTTKLGSGIELTLDFTTEPGIITEGSRSFSADPDWHRAETPICQQLHAFFACVNKQGKKDSFRRVSEASVTLTESSDQLLKIEQLAWLHQCPRTYLNEDITYAACDLLAGDVFISHDINPGNRAALELHISKLMRHLVFVSSAENWLSALQSHGLLQPK